MDNTMTYEVQQKFQEIEARLDALEGKDTTEDVDEEEEEEEEI